MSSEVNSEAAVTQGSEKMSWLELLVAIASQPRVVVGLPALATAIAILVAFLLPKWYLASARIMPPQQSQSNAVAILGQLGVLAGGAGQALGLKNPSDVYVAMLKSRTVADNLIHRFDLKRVYSEDYLVDARKELARNSRLSAGREGVISIDVEDTDPARAAALANAYVEELRTLTIQLAVSEASQRRLFFESQLKKSKTDLANAEIELQRYAKDAGLVNPQGQIGLSVSAAASLRAQITAKEIQLSAMRTFGTESNPDIRRAVEELSSLRAELRKMEKDHNAGTGDVLVPFGKAPEVGTEYVRRYRDMKYYETLFEVLAKQYEIARIDEAKDATLLQVLDVAVAPEKKSRPKRAVIVVVAFLLSSLLAVAIAIVRESLRRSMTDPKKSGQLERLIAIIIRWDPRRSRT